MYDLKVAGFNIKWIGRDEIGDRTKPKSQQCSAYWSKISQLERRASKRSNLLSRFSLDLNTDRSSSDGDRKVKL